MHKKLTFLVLLLLIPATVTPVYGSGGGSFPNPFPKKEVTDTKLKPERIIKPIVRFCIYDLFESFLKENSTEGLKDLLNRLFKCLINSFLKENSTESLFDLLKRLIKCLINSFLKENSTDQLKDLLNGLFTTLSQQEVTRMKDNIILSIVGSFIYRSAIAWLPLLVRTCELADILYGICKMALYGSLSKSLEVTWGHVILTLGCLLVIRYYVLSSFWRAQIFDLFSASYKALLQGFYVFGDNKKIKERLYSYETLMLAYYILYVLCLAYDNVGSMYSTAKQNKKQAVSHPHKKATQAKLPEKQIGTPKAVKKPTKTMQAKPTQKQLPTQKPQKSRSNPLLIILLLLFLLGLLGSTWFFFARKKSNPTPDPSKRGL